MHHQKNVGLLPIERRPSTYCRTTAPKKKHTDTQINNQNGNKNAFTEKCQLRKQIAAALTREQEIPNQTSKDQMLSYQETKQFKTTLGIEKFKVFSDSSGSRIKLVQSLSKIQLPKLVKHKT